MNIAHRRLRTLIMAGAWVTLCLVAFNVPWVHAGEDPGSGRTKTVQIDVLQYVWQLISYQTGRPICEVIIEHEGMPTRAEALAVCAEAINPPVLTPTKAAGATAAPTSTPAAPIDLNDFLDLSGWKFIEERHIQRTLQIQLPDIMLNINAPDQPVPAPFIILSAYDPAVEYHITAIRGRLNQVEFECTGTPCRVPITGDAVIEYWAVSSFGDESEHATGVIRLEIRDQNFTIVLSKAVAMTYFRDSCMDIWGMYPAGIPDWGQFPLSPDQLNTNKSYHYLTGRLINAGLVDVSGCPGSGLLGGLAPNACGVERAREAVTQWQNQFDPIIWLAAKDYGIPPRVIKTLIEVESQFWPGSSRNLLNEYGLAQLNQLGADVALRWEHDLFKQVCNGLLYDCEKLYATLPTWSQAATRGGLIKMIDADCPTCNNGIDLVKASQSIPLITGSLRANCHQSRFILDQYQQRASYTDMWKYTLVSYHSGYQCLADAIAKTKELKEQPDWQHVSQHFTCPDAARYVNDFFTSLESFDQYRLKPQLLEANALDPVFLPTATPMVAPTPVKASSRLRVVVYLDENQNHVFDPQEALDEVTVNVTFSTGAILSARTGDGVAVFDLTGRTIGAKMVVSLPDLFRQQEMTVVETGESLAVFRLDPLLLPNSLP